MLLTGLMAQAAVAAAPATPAAPPTQGVISYPVAYFSGQQVANAYEMLDRIPGFSLDTGASVRGFEGAAGNVLIDGRRPASKSDDLGEILRRIPVSAIERIDIIRGGAPGIDMQGKSVLANVVKKSGASFRGLFAVANSHLWDGRNMHGMRLEMSGGDGSRTWEAQARYGYGNDDGGEFGPQVRIAPDGSITRRSEVKSESDGLDQWLIGAYSQPLAGGRIALNGRAFWEKWKSEDTNRYIVPAFLGVADEIDPSHTRETEVGARWDRDFGAATKLELVGLRTDTDANSESRFRQLGDISEFRNDRVLSETIGRGVLKHQFSTKLSFELGGEAAYNDLDSRTRVAENGVPIPIPAANVVVAETRGEVFLKGAWRPTAEWTVDGGLRYEASRITSEGDVTLEKTLFFLKPRLALAWAPRTSTQLRFRVEREVGQLNFDDFVASSDFKLGTDVSAGNPNLNPEQAWVLEGEWEQRFWGGGASVLTYRHSKLTDAVDRGPVKLVTTDPATGQAVVVFFDQPTNIGDGTKDELTWTLNLPFDHFGWKGGLFRAEVNKRWSEVTDPTTHTARPISRLRPLEWQAHFSQDLPKYGTSFGADMYSGWSQTSYRFNYVSDVKLHNSFIVLWVERKLQPTLTLRAELQNLTSRGIRFNTAVYDPIRGPNTLAYTDDRDLTPGQTLYIRVRKTFGR